MHFNQLKTGKYKPISSGSSSRSTKQNVGNLVLLRNNRRNKMTNLCLKRERRGANLDFR